MTPEIFNARMAQIQLERDAINTLVHGMNSENLFRATLGHDLTYTMTEFDKPNIVSYSSGGVSTTSSMSTKQGRNPPPMKIGMGPR